MGRVRPPCLLLGETMYKKCLFVLILACLLFNAGGVFAGDERGQTFDVNDRLRVDVEGEVTISLTSTANSVRNYTRQVVSSHPTTLTSFTVPTGKELLIETWHLQTQGAIGLVELQVDGTAVDSIRFNNSANTNRTTAVFGGISPIVAAAGEIVRLQSIEGDTDKEFITGFNGLLRDV